MSEQRSGSQHRAPEVELLLKRAIETVDMARPMPLSTSVMINREELLDLLTEAAERLPEELRAARWLLKEREDYLAQARRDADDIIDAGRARAEQMVQRTEVVKAANQQARRTVEDADAEGRRMRNEAEDFCDQRLASFEIILERTAKMVAAGRAKLQSTGSGVKAEDAVQYDEFGDRIPPGADGDGDGASPLFNQDD